MYQDEKFNEAWAFMEEYRIATDDELSLACCLCGKTVETLEKVLDIRTGYRSIEQYKESEWGED